jgi:hypothetical protein
MHGDGPRWTGGEGTVPMATLRDGTPKCRQRETLLLSRGRMLDSRETRGRGMPCHGWALRICRDWGADRWLPVGRAIPDRPVRTVVHAISLRKARAIAHISFAPCGFRGMHTKRYAPPAGAHGPNRIPWAACPNGGSTLPRTEPRMGRRSLRPMHGPPSEPSVSLPQNWHPKATTGRPNQSSRSKPEAGKMCNSPAWRQKRG